MQSDLTRCTAALNEIAALLQHELRATLRTRPRAPTAAAGRVQALAYALSLLELAAERGDLPPLTALS